VQPGILLGVSISNAGGRSGSEQEIKKNVVFYGYI
jgi:hypothetical protein